VSLSLFLQDASTATREVQWNTTPAMRWFLYGSMLVALAVFGWGCWRRVRVWRIGKGAMRWDNVRARIARVLGEAGGQASVLRDRVPGIMHALLFFGFAALFAATVVVMIHHDLGLPIMRGSFYLYFQSFAVNVLGFLALLGLAAHAVRRYIARPRRLEHGKPADALLLVSLFLILVTGFLISGLRIRATTDPFAAWRPFSQLFGIITVPMWSTAAEMRGAHAWLWVTHVALWHAFLAITPFTKMLHVFTSPANLFFAPLDRKSHIPPIDLESVGASDTLGISTPFDMTWKQHLDLDACTECGRCQAVCPAWAEGKPLSPKRVILDLRDHVHARAPRLLEAQDARRRGDTATFDRILAEAPSLAGGVIREETLWACTTCRHCEVACPVGIEHVQLIVQLRQNLVMEQASAPEGIADMLANLDTREHPFRGVALDRTAWYRAAGDADTGE
jgi:nitrate reductase gamma subunit/ferredoxin